MWMYPSKRKKKTVVYVLELTGEIFVSVGSVVGEDIIQPLIQIRIQIRVRGNPQTVHEPPCVEIYMVRGHPQTVHEPPCREIYNNYRIPVTTNNSNEYKVLVGPGLAQLVERLAHRYSESTSSNPGNLTSATVCGDRTGCKPATKRSASVAPEVYLGKCTLHSPPQKANKAEPTLALKPRGDVTRNPK